MREDHTKDSRRSEAPVAQAARVVMRFDGLTALAGVSVEVRSGEVLGLIGPNGSGKTTLINLLSGALNPSAGRVSVLGRDVGAVAPHEVARLGVARTYQQTRLFDDMTVAENVEVGCLGRGVDPAPERVTRLLSRVGLHGHARRPAGTLAYGARRRLELARALAGRPRLLLLDEPAAGMNEGESDDLLATIESIRREDRCSVLVVDHDLRLIMRLCDRLHVIAEGETICEGAPAAVRVDPAVIKAYLGEAPEATPTFADGTGRTRKEELH